MAHIRNPFRQIKKHTERKILLKRRKVRSFPPPGGAANYLLQAENETFKIALAADPNSFVTIVGGFE